MDYFDAVHYIRDLESRPRPAYRPVKDARGVLVRGVGLERMRALLHVAGNPEKHLPIINVAGTSGKGSVSRMLHCIYHAAGKTVGTYYSPAVTTLIEEIEVNEQLIAPEEFVALVEWIKPLLEQVERETAFGIPSSFEAMVLIALKYFRDRQCDIVILEAGLGGTYDACNIADTQVAAVVTNLGLDHTNILGKTVAEIAFDKVGILKQQGRLFTRSQDPIVLDILQAAAHEKDAIFLPVEGEPHVLKADLQGSRFGYAGMTADLKVGGYHQMENAMIAYTVANLVAIDRVHIEEGLNRFTMPGRSEIVQNNPLIMLDGAHNADKIGALVRFLADQRVIGCNIVFGCLSDKHVEKMLAYLKPITRKLFITQSAYAERPVLPAQEIARVAKDIVIPYEVFERATDAFTAATKDATPTIVTGSMFLLGEIREKWYPTAEILERRRTSW